MAVANTSQKAPLITNFDDTNSPYQGCYAATGILGQPTLNGASLLGQTGLTDQICRNFCVDIATGHPFLYFGISNGVNCFCGNTPPAVVAGLPNESQCTTPNSGDPTQAGGGPNAINAWLASPNALSLSSGPPGGLPSSLPAGLPSGVSSNVVVPSLSLSVSLSSGFTSLPSGSMTSGLPNLQSLISSTLSLRTFSGVITLPTITAVPSNSAELSSLLSVINNLPPGFSLPASIASGVSQSVSVPSGTGLPSNVGQLSSFLSSINPSPSGVSVSAGSTSPSNMFTTIGSALPAVTPVADPSLLTGTGDPNGQFLGCLVATGLNGLPILNGPSEYSSSLTQVTCHAFCDVQPGAPFRFFAIEQGNLCHCGQALDTSNVLTDPTGCNMAAAGDPTQTQNGGGRRRLAVFQNLSPEPSVRPFSTIICSKRALHKICFFKVGIG
jgi:hypothetical protein